MTSLSSSLPFSIHNDILQATPSDLSSKLSLIEEIKRRAKASIQSKHYPEAEHLYNKAIETLLEHDDDETQKTNDEQLAILYSNRSLTRYQMGQWDYAIRDAQCAIEKDAMYLKAYWRLGQALFRMERYDDALKAYGDGVGTLGEGESDKAWRKEMDKCRQGLEEEKRLMEIDGAEAAPKEKKRVETVKKVTSSSQPIVRSNKAVAKKESGTNEPMVVDDEEFKQSDIVRGYKVVNGKKTSYFHNELSEEQKRLIGDIAPKPISTPQIIDQEMTDTNVSAWNKAGTWEEKDVTARAKESLRDALLLAEYTSDGEKKGVAKITKIDTLDGHASIATVRGKRKYIYEFSLSLLWELVYDEEEYTGTVKFPDVDGTCSGDYEMTECIVKTGSSPPMEVVNKFVKFGLKDDICKRIDEWVATLKAEYAL